MGDMRALAMPRVSEADLRPALESETGAEWSDLAHVAATTTLAGAIRRGSDGPWALALPIATLTDLVTLPGLKGEMRLPLQSFPGRDAFMQDPAGHWGRVRGWQAEASGRRLRTGIQVDDSLRRFVREHAPGRVGQGLLASRRRYASTIHSLIAAGVSPSDLRPEDPAAQLAAEAWAQAEVDVDSLGDPRKLLWVDLEEMAEQSSDAATDLARRIRAALDRAYGRRERHVVVHHGFYFYSPVQWALFQAMARTPGVDQVFVVHDDGENPAFSTWRYFFRSEWQMPAPHLLPEASEVTPAAAAFRDVLAGRAPQESRLSIVECRSPAELVRLWKDEDATDHPPARYAAASEQVDRYVSRLGRQALTDEDTDGPSAPHLSQLPVGVFLLALHGCITQADDGTASFGLTGDALLDMVASGYLDVGPAGGGATAPLLRRSLPFFGGCRTGAQWSERAARLVTVVEETVAPRGARDATDDDVDRIQSAVDNPLRLVPWADLSLDEARSLQVTVDAVIRLLEETTARERVVLGEHLKTVRTRLDRALRELPADEATAVEAKIRGLSVLTDEEIDVVGLVDVVAMVLGRTLDLEDDQDPRATTVTKLRGLDALSLRRADRGIHLANMAEDAFPTPVDPVGWPFTLEDLKSSDATVEPVTAGLLATRAQTAGLSDLYLFWLALDGVGDEHDVTVSWVSRSSGEHRRLSPIPSLLARPTLTEAVGEAAGGVRLSTGPAPAERAADRARPEPSAPAEDDGALVEALDTLDQAAAAASRACARRFAIQWAMGPTASFGPAHLQSMLYGNVAGALEADGENVLAARAAVNVVWPHLTAGQRATSLDKRVVKPGGAQPEWLLTLKGTRNGSKDLDAAYQVARGDGYPDELQMAPDDPVVLPPAAESAEACAACPVQSRCREWRDPRDER